MGIDLVHDEVEKELLTVSMGGGECFTNEKFLVASVCLSEDTEPRCCLQPFRSEFIMPSKGPFSWFYKYCVLTENSKNTGKNKERLSVCSPIGCKSVLILEYFSRSVKHV